jgi:Flp pilus assembly protein TadB
MKTIALHRPLVKGYNDNKFSIYFDGKLVAKLRNGETKEIKTEKNSVEIQAKYLNWFGSEKQLTDLQKNTTIDIGLQKSFINQTLIFTGPVLVALSTLFYNQSKAIFFSLILLGIVAFIYSCVYRKNKWLKLTSR